MIPDEKILQNFYDISEALKNCVDLQEKNATILKTMDDTDNKIIDIVLSLQKMVLLLVFITGILAWRVFLWDITNHFFLLSINFWKTLTEGYKILILGLIGTIPVGIITMVINFFIKEKLNKLIKNK